MALGVNEERSMHPVDFIQSKVRPALNTAQWVGPLLLRLSLGAVFRGRASLDALVARRTTALPRPPLPPPQAAADQR
jgi:hypothetical protein